MKKGFSGNENNWFIWTDLFYTGTSAGRSWTAKRALTQKKRLLSSKKNKWNCSLKENNWVFFGWYMLSLPWNSSDRSKTYPRSRFIYNTFLAPTKHRLSHVKGNMFGRNIKTLKCKDTTCRSKRALLFILYYHMHNTKANVWFLTFFENTAFCSTWSCTRSQCDFAATASKPNALNQIPDRP